MGIENLKMRKSTHNDKEYLIDLLNLCFLEISYNEALINLDNRYYLCIDDSNNMIIAMTGIYEDTQLGGLRLDWTCIHPKYKNQGILYELVKEMLNNVDTYNRKMYCSCWNLVHDDELNMVKLFRSFGLNCVMKAEKALNIHTNCKYKTVCKNYKTTKCKCLDDIFNNV